MTAFLFFLPASPSAAFFDFPPSSLAVRALVLPPGASSPSSQQLVGRIKGHRQSFLNLAISTPAGHALLTTIMATTGSQWQYTFILEVTALFVCVVVTIQTLSAYSKAYIDAPAQILTFVDAADSSVHENESYDRNVSRVQRLDDKRALSRLLREIQRGGDDLREELNHLLQTDNGDLASDGYSDLRDLRLRASARLLWASKRKGLEDKLRRLDMLRQRFLTVYLGIVATGLTTDPPQKLERKSSQRNSEKHHAPQEQFPEYKEYREYKEPSSSRPSLPPGMGDAIKRQRAMLRRLSLRQPRQIEKAKKPGWADVIRELQLSPLLHKRHASIERAMSERSDSPAPSMISEPPTPPGPAPIFR